jgi:urease accessory protein UreF
VNRYHQITKDLWVLDSWMVDDPQHWCRACTEETEERLDKYIEALNGAREMRKLARVETQTTWTQFTTILTEMPESWAELEQIAEDTGFNYFVVRK